MKIYILTIILSLPGVSTFANDSSYVKFILDNSLPVDKFHITVNDGINEHKIDPQNKPYWHGALFAPFGYVLIGYKNSDTSSVITKVFFKKGKSEISLVVSSIPDRYYMLDEKASVNIVPYKQLGGAAYDSFIKKSEDSLLAFYHKHKNSFGRDPELVERAFVLSDSLVARKIAFIRQHPDLYISFWLFTTEIVRTKLLSPEKLMELYDTKLPDNFKRTRAGEHAAVLVRNKIAVTSKGHFPDFSFVDINDNRFESSKLRGRYVLVQFWASWCAPCIEEIPHLKEINDRYADSTLTLISISIDKDASAFRNAIGKYAMNWPQVFGDIRLYEALAYMGIPQLYLIDPEGRTIYNRLNIADNDLVLLKKMIRERIGQGK
jgi:thiol-disulfide isomerase/thioredoxin